MPAEGIKWPEEDIERRSDSAYKQTLVTEKPFYCLYDNKTAYESLAFEDSDDIIRAFL